jgi:hypothetical protein
MSYTQPIHGNHPKKKEMKPNKLHLIVLLLLGCTITVFATRRFTSGSLYVLNGYSYTLLGGCGGLTSNLTLDDLPVEPQCQVSDANGISYDLYFCAGPPSENPMKPVYPAGSW